MRCASVAGGTRNARAISSVVRPQTSRWLGLKDIRAIRVRLQIAARTRELALFNLAIDSKLRSCDLVRLRVRDVCHGNVVAARTIVMQQKTKLPVQFEIT